MCFQMIPPGECFRANDTHELFFHSAFVLHMTLKAFSVLVFMTAAIGTWKRLIAASPVLAFREYEDIANYVQE